MKKTILFYIFGILQVITLGLIIFFTILLLSMCSQKMIRTDKGMVYKEQYKRIKNGNN